MKDRERSEWGEDGEITVVPLQRIHRAGGDAYVRLLSRDHPGGGLVPRGSVKVAELAEMFPEYVRWLTRDAYFTINGFWRSGTHQVADVRYLNACYVDLDHHLTGLGYWEAVKIIGEASDAGTIPMPSAIVRSGNGSWVVFLLADPDAPERGQRAFREGEEIRLHLAVNAELVRRLREAHPELSVDPACVDASRLLRVPGSVNTKAMVYVRCVFLAGPGGCPTYSLWELAERLGVGTVRPYLPAPTEPRRKVPSRRTGWLAANEARLCEFQRLRDLRGGFREGTRTVACLVYASLLARLGYAPAQVEAEVVTLAAECKSADGVRRDPLPPEEARSAAHTVLRGRPKSRYNFRSRTIAERLGVTRDEAEYLGLDQLHPDHVPKVSSRSYNRKTDPRAVPDRRAALLALVAELGTVPTVRQALALLRDKGFRAALGTVQGDFAALGLRSGYGVKPKGPQIELYPDAGNEPK